MMLTSRFLAFLCLLVVSTFRADAFVPKTAVTGLGGSTTTTAMAPKVSTSALMERRWNFNEGQGPWGLKKNAEIWNGRVSQVGFGLGITVYQTSVVSRCVTELTTTIFSGT